jgi:hypothetical protein
VDGLEMGKDGEGDNVPIEKEGEMIGYVWSNDD